MDTTGLPQIAALRRSRDALAARAATFNGDDLRRRSGASAWDVSQVLSHLGSGAEIGLAALEATLKGDDPPPREALEHVWARWDSMSPEQRLSQFGLWDEGYVKAVEGLSPESIASLEIGFAGMGSIDMASVIAFRLSEHTLHSWDVNVAFDSGATLPSDASELLLQLVTRVIGRTGIADAWTGDDVTIAVETSAPANRYWLRLADEVSFGLGDRPASGKLEIPSEALVRLMAGRLDAEHTPASVSIDGPASLDALRAVFPGY
jgi:uncharacterized protein (TIGR03083 family)